MSTPAPPDLGLPADAEWEMGWFPDPWQRHQNRFYDGEQWTEHVADGGFAGLDTEPVADLRRSRPQPEQASPPDGAGPRVIQGQAATVASVDDVLLLLDGRRGDDGPRSLLGADDGEAGWIETPGRARARRLFDRLAVASSSALTRLVVRAADGSEALVVGRPARRSAPIVDVSGPGGAQGTIEATSVRQGLRAVVRSADGSEVGVLEAVGPGAALRVTGPTGATIARLTSVWDIPGGRRHLPPGVLLLDRRLPPGVAEGDRPMGLLLGALLAPELLLPPPPPPA